MRWRFIQCQGFGPRLPGSSNMLLPYCLNKDLSQENFDLDAIHVREAINKRERLLSDITRFTPKLGQLGPLFLDVKTIPVMIMMVAMIIMMVILMIMMTKMTKKHTNIMTFE